jgi:hypothetical protein
MRNGTVALTEDIQGQSNSFHRRFIISALAFLSSILIIFVVGYLIGRYTPNPQDKEFIQKNFILSIDHFHAEKPEKYQYVVLTVLFPVLFFMLYFFYQKIYFSIKIIEKCSMFLYPACTLCIITLFYLLNKQTNLYIDKALISFDPMLVIFAILLAVFLVYIYSQYSDKKLSLGNVICFIAMLMIAFVTGWIYLTSSYINNGYSIYNFDAYYDPVYQVYSGKTLIKDFYSLYGFYPYFFQLIFSLVGGISILKFSFLLSLLSLITCLSLLAVVWINVKNKILALIGYATVIFFMHYLPFILNQGYFVQYSPHRLIFPSLILLNASLWMKANTSFKRVLVSSLGYALGALSILWNIETGIIVALAWCLFRIYCCAQDNFLKKAFFIQVLKSILFTLGSFLAAFGVMILITVVRSGMWPSINDIIYIQNIFSNLGFGMLPMSLFKPWLLLILVYAVGLVISIRDIRSLRNATDSPNPITPIYFMSIIVGMGLFLYYQGESHDYVFAVVIWPSILILVLYAQDCSNRLLNWFRTHKTDPHPANIFVMTDIAKMFLYIAFFVSFSASIPFHLYTSPALKEMLTKTQYYDNSAFKQNLSFIRDTSNREENIDLIVRYPTYYYTKLGIKDCTDLTSEVFWFLHSDIDKALDWLEKTNHTVYLDDSMASYLSKYNKDRFSSIMENRFILTDSFNGFYRYARR